MRRSYRSRPLASLAYTLAGSGGKTFGMSGQVTLVARIRFLVVPCACLLAFAVVPTPSAAQSVESTTPPAVTATPGPLRVQAVRPDLHVIEGAGGNVVVWTGADGIVMVDAGSPARATELFETVARIAPGRLRFVVDTHAHPDHVGGNELAARRGAIVIAHESVRARAGLAPGGKAPPAASLPVITTNDGLALHLNGDRVDVLHVADAHSAGDLVVRWAEADVLALGDVFWNGQYPLIDVAAGGSLAGTVAAVEAALARITMHTAIVPGHGPVANRADLAAYRDMLVTVGRKVREAVEQGAGLERVLGTHPTAEFDARYARAGATVTPDDFVRSVYADLTRK